MVQLLSVWQLAAVAVVCGVVAEAAEAVPAGKWSRWWAWTVTSPSLLLLNVEGVVEVVGAAQSAAKYR